MLECRLILDPPADGAWNMAVDEVLWDWSGRTGGCCLRLYRWQQATLSLGYFQTYEQRGSHAASGSCPIVRRISGGGAIVHDAELTYALAIPLSHRDAPSRQRLYAVVHQSIVELLARWDIEAAIHLAANVRRPAEEPFLCFQRRTPGDVVAGAFKVAGSAQRRSQTAVLQHGSLLLARSPAAPELPGLQELGGRSVAVDDITDRWLSLLSGHLDLRWDPSPLTLQERNAVTQLVAEKHAAEAWVVHRNHHTG